MDSEKVNIYHISPFWRMEPVISPINFFFLKFTPIALSNADKDTIEAPSWKNSWNASPVVFLLEKDT